MKRIFIILILAITVFMNAFLGCDEDSTTKPCPETTPRTYITIDSVPYINELDCDNEGVDTKEFIELYTVARNVPLDDYVVVLYNGNGDYSYQAYDLDGRTTNSRGFFVLGTSAVPNVDTVLGSQNIIQNGPDAVALYKANGTDFPPSTYVTDYMLIDAIVYGTNDPLDVELFITLLLDGTQLNEDTAGTAGISSLQRIPNGSGGYRSTIDFRVSVVTTIGHEVLGPGIGASGQQRGRDIRKGRGQIETATFNSTGTDFGKKQRCESHA
jgi:hypothetical protein